MKKKPQRQCSVTRESFNKEDLFRVVRTPSGEVILDMTGKANGRGAYVSKSVEVIEKGSVGLVYQGRVGAYQSHILLFERRDRAFEQEVPPSQGLYFDAYFVCAFFEQKFRLQIFERVVDLGRY